MKILFITSHLHLPQLYGGLQNSTDQLFRNLQKKGHEVALLAGLTHGGWFGWKSRIRLKINQTLKGHKLARDTILGYPVWRTWFPVEEAIYIVEQEKPDIIVVKSGDIVRIALAVKPTGIPLVMQLHDVEFHLHSGDFRELGDVICTANSHFTAGKYRDAFGVQSRVVYPFIAASKYQTTTTRENVTFINPHPQKGVDIAIAIARECPEIPFAFFESWPLKPEDRDYLNRNLATLPNVTLSAPVEDMKQVFGKSRILIAPSRWEEAYGRVATEAQFSGIPVIASNRGGLPEAVGNGGILIDPDGPTENWVAAVKQLWHDEQYYNEISTAAFNHSNRSELSLDNQVKLMEDVFTQAIRRAA